MVQGQREETRRGPPSLHSVMVVHDPRCEVVFVARQRGHRPAPGTDRRWSAGARLRDRRLWGWPDAGRPSCRAPRRTVRPRPWPAVRQRPWRPGWLLWALAADPLDCGCSSFFLHQMQESNKACLARRRNATFRRWVDEWSIQWRAEEGGDGGEGVPDLFYLHLRSAGSGSLARDLSLKV